VYVGLWGGGLSHRGNKRGLSEYFNLLIKYNEIFGKIKGF
jgi:hypothetical protein